MNRLIGVVRSDGDAVLAMALLTAGMLEAALRPGPTAVSNRWLLAGLAAIWSIAILWRRSYPLTVLAVVSVTGPIYGTLDSRGGELTFVAAYVIASWTVGRYVSRPSLWWGVAILAITWFGNLVVHRDTLLSDWVFVPLVYGTPMLAGMLFRERDLRMVAMAEETARLRYQQEENERRAVSDERTRIARELHDIVSHSLAVVAIQTQAVRRRLGPESAAEADDLRQVEDVARQALTEMRRLLGVLRADNDTAQLAPQPGVAQLDRLILDTRAAGVDVGLCIDGCPADLPPGVDLAAYRIVQESLTNVAKHAAGASAMVRLNYQPDAVEVIVTDTGRRDGSAVTTAETGGHGLVGIRERVQLYDGQFSCGPEPSGGFRVRATIPFQQRTPT
jgi:signal transduction histidine kinase